MNRLDPGAGASLRLQRIWFEQALTATLVLPLPRSEVFGFFAAAENLERITPPELRFEIVTPLPLVLQEGALVDYRLRLWGARFGWRTRIRVWQPPAVFEDEQLRGPYRLWVHRHEFDEVPGGTRITDRVVYALPWPPLGELARPWVRWQLRRIFSYRQRAIIRELLGDRPGATWEVRAGPDPAR